MDNEKVVRDEANYFFTTKISGARDHKAIDKVHDLKYRLGDFYSPELKGVFLDEIKMRLVEELQAHRNQAHKGQADPKCIYEKNAEKLLFYINQEIATFPKIAHQKEVLHPKHVRNKVFVSYCHADTNWLNDIKRHFKPFLKQIDFWDDSRITPGQKWKEEIKKAIDESKVAILLVTTDFLGSEFIATDELPPLLSAAEQDGAVILIVILRPCLFEEFPDLNQFQAMNPPDKPVSKMNDDEKEELFVNLVRQTKRILE